MVKVLNVKSDGSYEINFGVGAANGNVEDAPQSLPDQMLANVLAYHSAITAEGANEIHLEVNSNSSFCHLLKSGSVDVFEIGDFVDVATFNAIVDGYDDLQTFIDDRIAAEMAAAEEAARLAEEQAAAVDGSNTPSEPA